MTYLKDSFERFITTPTLEIIEERGIPQQSDEWEALETLMAVLSYGKGKEVHDLVLDEQLEDPNALWPYAILYTYQALEDAHAEGIIPREQQKYLDSIKNTMEESGATPSNPDQIFIDKQTVYERIQAVGLTTYLTWTILDLLIVLENIAEGTDLNPTPEDVNKSKVYVFKANELLLALVNKD